MDQSAPPLPRVPTEAMTADSKVQEYLSGLDVPDGMPMDDRPPHSLVTKCVAEFVGLVIFVFIGTVQASGSSPFGILHAAFAHGFTIFLLIAGFGHLSGGHFNPAVTVGVTAVGRLPPLHAVCYIVAQLLGGLIGSLIARLVLGGNLFEAVVYGATFTAKDVGWYQALTAEAFTTFMLVQTVLMTAVDTGSNVLAPLAIGITVAVDIFAIGSLTGASMNPARSFGPNIVGTLFHKRPLRDHFWTMHYIYYLGPVLGAVIAAALYRAFFSRESRLVK